jgi:hypothetical protein
MVTPELHCTDEETAAQNPSRVEVESGAGGVLAAGSNWGEWDCGGRGVICFFALIKHRRQRHLDALVLTGVAQMPSLNHTILLQYYLAPRAPVPLRPLVFLASSLLLLFTAGPPLLPLPVEIFVFLLWKQKIPAFVSNTYSYYMSIINSINMCLIIKLT